MRFHDLKGEGAINFAREVLSEDQIVFVISSKDAVLRKGRVRFLLKHQQLPILQDWLKPATFDSQGISVLDSGSKNSAAVFNLINLTMPLAKLNCPDYR